MELQELIVLASIVGAIAGILKPALEAAKSYFDLQKTKIEYQAENDREETGNEAQMIGE